VRVAGDGRVAGLEIVGCVPSADPDDRTTRAAARLASMSETSSIVTVASIDDANGPGLCPAIAAAVTTAAERTLGRSWSSRSATARADGTAAVGRWSAT